MEWEFTPEQVVKGEIGYALEDFRRDLAAEVRNNLGPASPEQMAQTTDLLYETYISRQASHGGFDL